MGDNFGENFWDIFFPILKDFHFISGTTVRDFTQMNELCEKYGDKLVILAFPTNQFGHFRNNLGDNLGTMLGTIWGTISRHFLRQF